MFVFHWVWDIFDNLKRLGLWHTRGSHSLHLDKIQIIVLYLNTCISFYNFKILWTGLKWRLTVRFKIISEINCCFQCVQIQLTSIWKRRRCATFHQEEQCTAKTPHLTEDLVGVCVLKFFFLHLNSKMCRQSEVLTNDDALKNKSFVDVKTCDFTGPQPVICCPPSGPHVGPPRIKPAPPLSNRKRRRSHSSADCREKQTCGKKKHNTHWDYCFPLSQWSMVTSKWS